MKKTHFKIGLLTACLVSISSVASAQSCGAESCDSRSCRCAKKHCDDKGLLEVINNAASNFESSLASMLPDRKKHIEKAKCDCDKCSAPSDFAIQYTELTPSHRVAPYDAPHIAPPVAQPEVMRPHNPRMMVPSNPIVDPIPMPNSRRLEVVPSPDSNIDPFKDDSTTRTLRTIPSRPASYLRSETNVQTDPQASNLKSMRSVLMSKAASKSISDSANGLAKTTSTRRMQPHITNASQQVENFKFEQAAPEVVPASLSQPMPSLRNPTATPAADVQFDNPLRAQ